MKKTSLLKIFALTIFSFFTVSIILIGVALYKLDNITIRQTKDFAIMYVDENSVLDGDAIVSPPQKYRQLLEIDLEMRKKLADYMKEHNLKLKSGKQRFVRNNPTFKELTENGFEFIKC